MENLPKNCPSCRSTVWMKPFENLTCTRCGHEWRSTDDSPRRCPSCGTYRWNDVPTVYNCVKCDHSWNAKRDWPPKRCPLCRSTTWRYRAEESEKNRKAERKSKSSCVMSLSPEEQESIISRYSNGESCTKISLSMGIPFSVVFSVVNNTYTSDFLKI